MSLRRVFISGGIRHIALNLSPRYIYHGCRTPPDSATSECTRGNLQSIDTAVKSPTEYHESTRVYSCIIAPPVRLFICTYCCCSVLFRVLAALGPSTTFLPYHTSPIQVPPNTIIVRSTALSQAYMYVRGSAQQKHSQHSTLAALVDTHDHDHDPRALSRCDPRASRSCDVFSLVVYGEGVRSVVSRTLRPQTSDPQPRLD